jgi:TolA-binding protein
MKYAYIASLLLLIAACESPKEKMLNDIKNTEVNDSIFSPQLLNERKRLYLEFADKYPDDEQAPVFMFKAAQLCNGLASHHEAVQILNELMDKYPKSSVAENALFLQAYIFENALNNTEAAERTYKKFLEMYPESEMAEDAEMSLKYLGKTPEQIWDEMNKN